MSNPVPPPDRLARLPLRAELYLVAHDENRGGCHLRPRAITAGLAAAVLLELWLARRVAIGWTFDSAARRWLPAKGRLTITNAGPAGDPLADAAVATVRQVVAASPGSDQLDRWLRRFAAGDLRERIRTDLLAAGVLRHTTHRRYGLARIDRYIAADGAWAVRARARVRAAVRGHAEPYRVERPPDQQCAALCGLISALGLASRLYTLDMTDTQLRHWLGDLVAQHDRAITEVTAAVAAVRGLSGRS